MTTFVLGRPSRPVAEVTEQVLRGVPRRITEYGEEILHRPCQEVVEFGADRWGALIDDMFTTMWIAEGCGLAANQVDVDARLFVYDLIDECGDRHLGHVFNPLVEVMSAFAGEQYGGEGCLSVPGANELLTRPARVNVRGVDLDGQAVSLEASGYFARCLVHEAQHLDGTLYVDHLDPSARDHALADSAAQRSAVLARRAARQNQLAK